MGSKQVEFHEQALAEAQAAYEWYAARSPTAAEAFMTELDEAIDQIQEFPNAGVVHLSGSRRQVMRRFPFSVIYREREEIIQVVAVAHGRRRPGYWKKRIKH
jgi:toxin ParE1/3/4